MHQQLIRPMTTHAAHEYPAYALQYPFRLPAELRDRFLQSFAPASCQKYLSFQLSGPHVAPTPCALARAYHHFKASADGLAASRPYWR